MADWKEVIASVAPAIATALGGPLAGVATKALSDKLLGRPDASQQEVEAAVQGMKPEDLVKLKQIDAEFKAQLVSAGIKLEEIAAQDRNSARDREIRTGDSWTPRGLAILVVGGYMYVQWFILTGVIDESMREIAMRSMGVLDTSLGLCLSYYFGSSAGSKTKDETINSISEKKL